MAIAAEYYKNAPERSMRGDIVVLIAMCVFAFLVLGAFLAIKLIPASDIETSSFFTTYFTKADDASFKLGVVKLGTTVAQGAKRHPNSLRGVTASGSVTMSFVEDNNRYMVWYGKNGLNHTAYKARQTSTVINVSEDDFIGSIAERYGAPSLSSCSRRVMDGMRDCHFSWWIPGQVRMDVNSRQNPQTDTPVLQVTVLITDTRQEGRLRSTAQRTQALKSY